VFVDFVVLVAVFEGKSAEDSSEKDHPQSEYICFFDVIGLPASPQLMDFGRHIALLGALIVLGLDDFLFRGLVSIFEVAGEAKVSNFEYF
jgi:hypothetical protein